MSILPLQLKQAFYVVNNTTLLRDLSLSLSAGAITVVLGANGAGKSSFLKLCHGLVQPSQGQVLWAGKDNPKRRQAFVFQRPVLLRRSVLKNVLFALNSQQVAKSKQPALAEQALSQVGLLDKASRAARSLSIGEQQKLAIARATALSPEVLFMDEPTSSLDPEATSEIESLVRILHDSGTKIVMSTHNLRQAKRMADEVIFIHKGQILEQTAATSFFTSPASAEAKNFLS